MIPGLEEACGEKFPPGDQLHTSETNDFLKRLLKKMDVECTPPQTNTRMIDKLVGELLEEKCINPTFITVSNYIILVKYLNYHLINLIQGHPQMMSPLAKYHRDIPGLCERLIISPPWRIPTVG